MMALRSIRAATTSCCACSSWRCSWAGSRSGTVSLSVIRCRLRAISTARSWTGSRWGHHWRSRDLSCRTGAPADWFAGYTICRLLLEGSHLDARRRPGNRACGTSGSGLAPARPTVRSVRPSSHLPRVRWAPGEPLYTVPGLWTSTRTWSFPAESSSMASGNPARCHFGRCHPARRGGPHRHRRGAPDRRRHRAAAARHDRRARALPQPPQRGHHGGYPGGRRRRGHHHRGDAVRRRRPDRPLERFEAKRELVARDAVVDVALLGTVAQAAAGRTPPTSPAPAPAASRSRCSTPTAGGSPGSPTPS